MEKNAYRSDVMIGSTSFILEEKGMSANAFQKQLDAVHVSNVEKVSLLIVLKPRLAKLLMRKHKRPHGNSQTNPSSTP